jgi:hypothetical protein
MADKWTEIRSLAEQGVPYADLAQRYGLTPRQIENKSYYDGWLTPGRVNIKALQQTAFKDKRESGLSQSDPLSRTSDSPNVAAALAETWQQKAENLRILSFETAVDAIKRAKGLIAIETASDLKAAVHVARQATGVLDTEAPAISLNLGGGGGFFAQAGPVYEVTEPEGIGELEGPLTLEGCGV